jgi:secretion/DNA translocation related CpaE-like protein
MTMQQALLISSNPLIIEEFKSIAALVNVELIVTREPTQKQLTDTQRIFVDHETNVADINLAEIQIANSDGLETSLVLAGAATTRSWQLAAEIGAKHIVLIPESRQWLVDYIKAVPRKLAQLVSLTGITGGAGTTTIALALARACAKSGRSVTLVDLDFQSVGLDIAAGCEKSLGLNWSAIRTQAAQADGDAIIAMLPEIEGVRLLANDSLGTAPELSLQTQVVEQIISNCDVVLLDAGRWKSESVINSLEITERLFVLPNTIRACANGREIVGLDSAKSQQLIVRELPGSGLHPGMVAETLDRPLAAVIPTDPRMCELSEQGLALGANPLSKFNRPLSALSNQIFGEDHVLRVA